MGSAWNVQGKMREKVTPLTLTLEIPYLSEACGLIPPDLE